MSTKKTWLQKRNLSQYRNTHWQIYIKFEVPDHVEPWTARIPEINTHVAFNKNGDKNVEAFRVESPSPNVVINWEQRNKLWLRDNALTVEKETERYFNERPK